MRLVSEMAVNKLQRLSMAVETPGEYRWCLGKSVTFTGSSRDNKFGSVAAMYTEQSRAGLFVTVEFLKNHKWVSNLEYIRQA